MNLASFRRTAVLLLLLSAGPLRAQEPLAGPPRVSASFVVSQSDTTIALGREYLIPGSERLETVTGILLASGNEYLLDARHGRLSVFSSGLFATLRAHGDSTASAHLKFSCFAFGYDFKPSYSLFVMRKLPDSVGGRSVRLAEPTRTTTIDDFFGSGIQKSGSLVRGFTVGTDRDLTLNSGFRMQLSGRLSNDIDITAALTDENSPIQPEGTTQTLREVDKVFVQIRHPSYMATLGDFTLTVGGKEGGEFGRVERKLQGAQGVGHFPGGGTVSNVDVSVTGGTARGKFNTNRFGGQDGVQGPYRLSGISGETQIVIVAGSEQVYLDGIQLTRGETNDYVIEYGSGEIVFSSKRIITNASRIVVDFEYTDRQFSRNFVGASVGASLFDRRASLRTSVYQEADDPDAPIDVTLDDQSKAILSRAGADRMRASLPGVRLAPRDSVTGLRTGQYLLRDTLIAGRTISILVYAPGEPSAMYSASFSPVDRVPADSAGYVRIAPGMFQFAGLGAGNYLPLQFLPMPQRHQLVDVNGSVNVGSGLSIAGELAGSRFDANRFSDSTSVTGSALKVEAQFRPGPMSIAGTNVGQMELSLTERRVERTFAALDRFNDVEFSRTWNVQNNAGSDEEIRQAELRYAPVRQLKTSVLYGLLDRQNDVRSTRMTAGAELADSSLPKMSYRIERLQTNERALAANSAWTRQSGTAGYNWSTLTGGIGFQLEDRRRTLDGSDSATAGSFAIAEGSSRLGWSYGKIGLGGEFSYRTEDSSAAGVVKRALEALTQSYSFDLRDWNDLTTGLTLSLRDVRFTEEFRHRGNADGNFLLLRSHSRYAPLRRALDADLYYEFSNQRSARLDRVFVRVDRGTGNYRYLGDLNHDGVAEENEFEQTRFDGDYVVMYVPSDQLTPVSDLKSGLRIRLQPARLIDRPSTALERALRAISTETSLLVNERSRDPEKSDIYLLKLSRFLDARNTLSGSQQVTQDLFLFEGEKDLSLRFRYNARYGLMQLVSATERSEVQERSVRIRSELVPEIGNQTDITSSTDIVRATAESPRVRNIESNGVTSDFSYRPDRLWEVGFEIGAGRATNALPTGTLDASMNEQGIRATYAIPMRGQVRAEFHREEVLVTGVTTSLPFELTGGKAVGRSWLWQIGAEYRLTANLQLSLQYDGRTEGGRPPVHTARAEARALF